MAKIMDKKASIIPDPFRFSEINYRILFWHVPKEKYLFIKNKREVFSVQENKQLNMFW